MMHHMSNLSLHCRVFTKNLINIKVRKNCYEMNIKIKNRLKTHIQLLVANYALQILPQENYGHRALWGVSRFCLHISMEKGCKNHRGTYLHCKCTAHRFYGFSPCSLSHHNVTIVSMGLKSRKKNFKRIFFRVLAHWNYGQMPIKTWVELCLESEHG